MQLDYAVNRSYSFGQGRFTQVDPLGAGASSVSNPQSNNLFAYTVNNPVDFVDPSGLNIQIIYGRNGTCSIDYDETTNSVRVICWTDNWNTPDPGTGGDPGGGGGGLEDLVNDRLKTNSGQCESKLNALMKALGKGNDFRKFAQNIMSGKDKLKRTVSMNETNNLGEYDPKTRTLNLDPRNADNGFVFIHEALHAAGAGMFGGSFDHNQILEKIAKVEGLNPKSIEKEISSIVQERERTTPFKDAKEKAEFVDLLYSNRMNWWLNNYCKAEGGSQQWQNFAKKHPK